MNFVIEGCLCKPLCQPRFAAARFPHRSGHQAGCSGSRPIECTQEYEVRLPMSFLSRRRESVFVNPVSSTVHMTFHRLRSLFGGQAYPVSHKISVLDFDCILAAPYVPQIGTV